MITEAIKSWLENKGFQIGGVVTMRGQQIVWVYSKFVEFNVYGTGKYERILCSDPDFFKKLEKLIS